MTLPSRPAHQLAQAANQLIAQLGNDEISKRLKQPIIILSAPRAGSTLLFEQLQKIEGFWSIGGESHIVYASLPHLRFENANRDSGCLTGKHADASTKAQFKAALLYLVRNSKGKSLGSLPVGQQPTHIQLIEKTPRNALTIDFLLTIFPHAKFVYLHREAKANIASIASAWEEGQISGRFVTYANLPEISPRKWCFLLPRGWRDMRNRSIFDIAAYQWQQANHSIVDALQRLPEQSSLFVDYDEFIAQPQHTLKRIIDFSHINTVVNLPDKASLPLSKTTLTPPSPEKWKRYTSEFKTLERSLQVSIDVINHVRQAKP